MDFESALDFCISKDYLDGAGANVIPVGKLRHLINAYSQDEVRDQFDIDKEEGPFHVNAVKSWDGLWREFPNGRLVNFHHFPQFEAFMGKEGDTLIWDSSLNELAISDRNVQYKVICYRPKRDKGIFLI